MGLFDDLSRLARQAKNIKNLFDSVSGFVYKPIEISKVPESAEEFVQLRNQLATKPEGGAAMFLLALKVYVENPELGKQFIVLSVDKSRLQPGDWYKGYQLVVYQQRLMNEQLAKIPYVVNSYIKGATPENNYSVQLPYVYEFTYDKASGDPSVDRGVKVYVKCYGADRHRPIYMKVNDKGIWKADEWSSILVSVVPPASKTSDEL